MSDRVPCPGSGCGLTLRGPGPGEILTCVCGQWVEGPPIVIEEPVHDWFGLSYASYLVLPRVVMQSMPVEWQRRMVALLNEAGALMGGHYGENQYRVRLMVNRKPVDDPLAHYRHERLEPKPLEWGQPT